MNETKEKTALNASVGADAGQSIQSKTTEIITAESPEINDLEDISQEKFFQQMQRMADPAYLHTVSMNELYETVYQSKQPVIEGLLYSGTYLFAGAPKVGKSFFMAQLAYHVSTGQRLWEYEVHQGTVLYLALEDDYQRLQERMSRMFGVEGTDKLHFAICAKQLGAGLPSFDAIPELLKLVGLHNTGKKRAKNFSLGMKQRLGIAIALAGDPDFLILDEPTNGLDPQGIIEMRELILRLNRERQMTVLISSHILDELSRLATHYGIIDGGKMVKELSAEELENACRKCMRMEVTKVTALTRVLEGMGIDYKVLSETKADVYAKINISQLTLALAKEGCEVLSIEEKDESLESYFVSLVGGGSHG